jgi:uncharacterized delta-60 repeat protein
MIVIAWLASGGSVHAAAGDLDNSFGDNGTALASAPDPSCGGAQGLVLQADGKIVLAGARRNLVTSGCDMALARFGADGALDLAFGASGFASVSFDAPAVENGVAFGYANAVALQSDGKLIAAGAGSIAMPPYTGPALARFNGDGSIDPGLGVGGRIVTAAGPAVLGGGYYTLAIQPDGRIVAAGAAVAGAFGGGTLLLARHMADGSLDQGFGSNGFAPTAGLATGFSATFSSVILQADGKIVASGVNAVDRLLGPTIGLLARFGANGLVDTSFGAAGVVRSAGVAFFALVQQPDGKLVVTGGAPGSLVLARFQPDGSIDSGFGSNGSVTAPLVPGGSGPYPLALQPDGKLVTAALSGDRVALYRFNADGSLDQGFGSGGIASASVGYQPVPHALAVQPDQKIVAAAEASAEQPGPVPTTAFALARFLGERSSSIVLTSSLNPSPDSSNVSFSASIAGHAPTGSVTFRNGGAPIAGCVAVPVAVSGSAGTALCPASLPAGTHSIAADYSGDAANLPASATFTQVVSLAGETAAIEYYHRTFRHYFVSSLPPEVAALDAHRFPGWQRSGLNFAVYPSNASAGTVPVCRFFSGPSFAPKSSHFYTPYALECAQRQQEGIWMYEGSVFDLVLSSPQGGCPAGLEPLYRLYNNGQGGAPNHRYTRSLAVFNEMIAELWTPEGNGIGVIGCVPIQ